MNEAHFFKVLEGRCDLLYYVDHFALLPLSFFAFFGLMQALLDDWLVQQIDSILITNDMVELDEITMVDFTLNGYFLHQALPLLPT